MSHDERSPRPTPASITVSGLRLGHWREVEHRLRPRLVHLDRAGPVGVRPPTVPGFGLAPVALDVGIEVADGIVRLDHDLIRSWARSRAQIWSAAQVQARKMPRPRVREVRVGGSDLLVAIGDRWVSGLLLCPAQLGSLQGPRPSRSLVAVGASERVLVLGPVTDSRPGTATEPVLRTVAAKAVGLASDLAAIEESAGGRPALPLAPLLLPTEGSFPGRWILE